MKQEYISTVKEGKLQMNVSKMIAHILSKFEGKRVIITIEKLSSKRSSQQNRLLHMHIGILAKEFGFTLEEMKSALKTKFLITDKVCEKTGEIMQYIKDTSALSKDEFSEFIERVIQFGAEYGVILPLPDDLLENEHVSVNK